MDNKYNKVLCEALDCKEPYETDVTIDGFRLCSFFNYYYANAVYAERVEDNLTVGWDQYENQLYIEGPNFESKQYTLTKQPELTANIEEVRNILPTILAEGNIENFPVSQFLDLIDTVNKDILANYPIYWDEEHQGHRKVAALGESVPKENLEDCYKVLDELATQLGFTLEVDNEFTGKKYVKFKNTNYTHFIDFTPEMDKDQLEWSIFNNNKLAEQDVWTIQDAEDIKKAFNELIIPRMEGLE